MPYTWPLLQRMSYYYITTNRKSQRKCQNFILIHPLGDLEKSKTRSGKVKSSQLANDTVQVCFYRTTGSPIMFHKRYELRPCVILKGQYQVNITVKLKVYLVSSETLCAENPGNDTITFGNF